MPIQYNISPVECIYDNVSLNYNKNGILYTDPNLETLLWIFWALQHCIIESLNSLICVTKLYLNFLLFWAMLWQIRNPWGHLSKLYQDHAVTCLMSRCSHSFSKPELYTKILNWYWIWEWVLLSGVLESICISLEKLTVSPFNSAFNYITLKSAMGEVTTHRNQQMPSIREIFSPAGPVVIHLPAHLRPYWWINTGILHAAPHGHSVGIIPNQYSAVYQPSSLQQSRAEYIVQPKVTQPVKW